MRIKKILFAILILSFLVRLAGIGYGLPLWLVADEPPFILGALKMVELKTAIPGFHLKEFRSVLYYPPYVSYFYLPFFATVLGLKYFSFGGDRISFINYLGADLSDFFMAARLLNILLAVLSVYLVYQVSKNIFRDEWTALASSFFISTSLLHILLSITARQWLAVSFIFTLVVYLLTEPALSFKKRYFLSVLAVGLGMGVSAISSVFMVLIVLHYLFFEEKRILELLKDKFVYLLILLFIFLAAIPLVIYPSSIGFGGKITFFNEKSITDFLLSPFNFLKPLLFAEPILILFLVSGLIFSFIKYRKLFWIFLTFIFIYSCTFYMAFRFEDRFLSPLLPMIAILAGFGFREFFAFFYRFEKFIAAAALAVVILLPAIFALRLGYLAYKNDSRENLRMWVEKNVSEDSRIITDVYLMRLSSNKAAIEEQQKIDPASLRQADRSELYFGKNPIYPSFHALNFNLVENALQKNITKYANDNSYDYLVLSEDVDAGDEMVSFGENSGFSISESRLGKNPFQLFETKSLGPAVSLYKIR